MLKITVAPPSRLHPRVPQRLQPARTRHSSLPPEKIEDFDALIYLCVADWTLGCPECCALGVVANSMPTRHQRTRCAMLGALRACQCQIKVSAHREELTCTNNLGIPYRCQCTAHARLLSKRNARLTERQRQLATLSHGTLKLLLKLRFCQSSSSCIGRQSAA
eukprot:Tamp_28657.p2 GENE.Tamp_28657~~Tamp_28657.p2  ORF type:complete len:163 (-),score=10.39 Tamp_28657:124-612(-)